MIVTNYDGRLEAMAGYCETMYENLAKINNAWHDTVANAYSFALPEKYLDFKRIKQIGGKTIVWNQLVDIGTTSVTTVTGHKYYTVINGSASIITSDGTAITVVDDTADMVCDLTLMFGSGNEPATVSAFTALFPAAHYSYNSGILLSAGVTSVVSKDSTDTEIDIYSIPADIQALDGYGWSAGSAYNYVDFDRKVFVQNVGKVTLDGTQTLALTNWRPKDNSVAWAYPYSAVEVKLATSGSVPGNIAADKLPTVSYGGDKGVYDGDFDGIALPTAPAYSIFVRKTDTSLTTQSAINTYLAANPIDVYYELNTPVEIDVSEYISEYKLKAEAGGTLTFENQHEGEYNIPVPVELEYIGV